MLELAGTDKLHEGRRINQRGMVVPLTQCAHASLLNLNGAQTAEGGWPGQLVSHELWDKLHAIESSIAIDGANTLKWTKCMSQPLIDSNIFKDYLSGGCLSPPDAS